jgi:hypothetical protein
VNIKLTGLPAGLKALITKGFMPIYKKMKKEKNAVFRPSVPRFQKKSLEL